MTRSSPVTLDGWLRRLDWSLHALPQKDRAEITREIQSHIDERIAQGVNAQDVLAALGPPEEYARGFHDEFELSKALGSRGLIRMVRVVAYRLPRSFAAFLALIAVLCLGLFAVAVTTTALMHFVDATFWGLWLTSHSLLFGYVDNPSEGRELLGAWIYPFAVLCLVACWMVGQAVLLWALRTIARH